MTSPGGPVIGEAFVSILASGRNFTTSLRRELLGARRVSDNEGERAGEQYADGFGRGVRDGIGRSVNGGSIGSTLAGLAGTLTKGLAVGIAAGLSGLALQASIGGIVALIAALAPLVGVIGALPALLTAGGAAAGTLALGFNGIGEAISSLGDAEAFADAIAVLSPNARATAEALRVLKPALDDLQLAVQDNLFQGFADTLRTTGEAILPVLRAGLTDLGSQFNVTGQEFAAFLRDGQTLGVLSGLLGDTSEATAILNTALRPVLDTFRDLVGVGGTFLPRLATAITDVSTRFADFLSNASASGALADFIDAGFTAFTQLGNIIGSAGSILLSVLQAGQSVGGGLLANVGIALDGIADFLNSTAGEDSLGSFFAATRDAATAVVPVLGAVLGVIGNLAPIFADLATGVAPGLVVALGGLAEGLANLLPAAEPLGLALGGVLVALTPLLPQLGETAAVLFTELTNALVVVTPLVADIAREVIANQEPFLNFARAVGDLVGAFDDLTSPLFTVIGALPLLGGAFGGVGDSVPVLTSQLRALSDAAGLVAGAIGAVAGIASRLPGASGPARTVRRVEKMPFDTDAARDSSLANRAKDLAAAVKPVFRKVGTSAGLEFTRGVAASGGTAAAAASEVARRAREALQEQATGIRSVVSELEATVRKYQQFRDRARDQAKDFASLSAIFTDPSRTSAGAFVEGLATRLAALRLFATNLRSLAARGLDRSVLEQIGGLGPEQGRAFAAALAQGTPAQIAEINRLQRQVNAASTGVATTATTAAFGDAQARAQRSLDEQNRRLAAIEAAIKASSAKTGKAVTAATNTTARTTDTRTRTAVAR